MYIDFLAYVLLLIPGIGGIWKGLAKDESLSTFIGMIYTGVVIIKITLVIALWN